MGQHPGGAAWARPSDAIHTRSDQTGKRISSAQPLVVVTCVTGVPDPPQSALRTTLVAVTSKPPATAPAPLVTAASLVAVEGVLIVVLGVLEIFALSAGRLIMGLTTALFFVVYGVGLVLCGWAITRGRAWARGPILLAQLIQLGLAWSFRDSPTTLVAVAIAVVAAVVLAGMLHPATLAALEEHRTDARGPA